MKSITSADGFYFDLTKPQTHSLNTVVQKQQRKEEKERNGKETARSKSIIVRKGGASYYYHPWEASVDEGKLSREITLRTLKEMQRSPCNSAGRRISVTRNYFENLVRPLENGSSDVNISQAASSRTSTSKASSSGDNAGRWSSNSCTTVNSSSATVCSMCQG